LLIVFEGLDRVGKTTQISLLVDQFAAAQVPVRSFRFPGIFTICSPSFRFSFLYFVPFSENEGKHGRLIFDTLAGRKQTDATVLAQAFSQQRHARRFVSLINLSSS